MPTYDYKCESCGHTFAAFHGMTEEPLKDCPECGKEELRRLIGSGAGIIFKGSGFYETDYKRSRVSPSKNGGDSGSSDSKSPDSSTKSDSDKSSDD